MLRSYFKTCGDLYEQAQNYLERDELLGAYVYLKRFLTFFLVTVGKHNAYQQKMYEKEKNEVRFGPRWVRLQVRAPSLTVLRARAVQANRGALHVAARGGARSHRAGREHCRGERDAQPDASACDRRRARVAARAKRARRLGARTGTCVRIRERGRGDVAGQARLEQPQAAR
jgi:hypothetical protein